MDDEHSHRDEEHRAAQDDRARLSHPGRNGGRHHPYRFAVYSLLALILGLVVAGGVWWGYWNFYARFRPVTLAKNQAEIQKLLDQADWVSPGRSGAPIYLITFRACDDCTAYQREEFPKLAAANVDTRVIVYARPDREGLAQSTAAERSTVAELWINRDWRLYADWMATPRKSWTAPNVRSADGSFARTAVVNATRGYIDQLSPLLKGAGVAEGYPLLIWRDKEGYLKACACFDRRSWHFIREDLGAPSKAPETPIAPVPPFAPAPTPVPTAPEPAPVPPVVVTPDPKVLLPTTPEPSAGAPVPPAAPAGGSSSTGGAPAAVAKPAPPAAVAAPSPPAPKKPQAPVKSDGKSVFY